jgi:hypothetical protein
MLLVSFVVKSFLKWPLKCLEGACQSSHALFLARITTSQFLFRALASDLAFKFNLVVHRYAQNVFTIVFMKCCNYVGHTFKGCKQMPGR